MTKKHAFSLTVLWLALLLLAFAYTDRQSYTWTYDRKAVSSILMDNQQAQENEAQARAAYAKERADALERRKSREWNHKETYSGAPMVRAAQDGETGLNLMWGDYEVEMTYASPLPLSVRVVSAGRQAFIEGGDAQLPAGEHTERFAFTLTDSAEHVALAGDLPEGAKITNITVRKVCQRVISPDLLAAALLAGAVMTVLLALSWDDSRRGRERRFDAAVIVGAAVFASMPLLWQGIYGGHDLHFHLNRIEGIAAGLRAGQFPVRIHASTLLGYGYAAPQFYPEWFLYIPAVMRNLGVSLAMAVRLCEMSINLLTALSAYACGRRLFAERKIALGASVLYTLCMYRLVNLYVRATIGESLAMVFFPLLLAALLDVLTGDERRWPMMALAMTGIFMSHLLSTLFAALLCALGAVLCVKNLLREPRRILAILKAAAVTALCSAAFLVPMLSYTLGSGINTSVALDAWQHVMKLGAYLVGFPGDHAGIPDSAKDFAYTVGVVPGYAVMIGCALLLVRRYVQGRDALQAEEAVCDKKMFALLAVGALLLLAATEVFPWDFACNLPRPFSTFFKQIQYPWRLVGVAAPMLCIAAAWGYLREERWRTPMLFVLTLLCVITGGYTMQSFVQQDAPLLFAESFCDTRIGQHEYLYPNTEKATLEPGAIVAGKTDNYAVSNYSKRGTNLSFTIDLPEGCAYLDVPLLYYPGYRAQVNGQDVRVVLGESNVIRLYDMGKSEDIAVRIWYEEPMAWRIALYVSGIGAALLAAAIWQMKRRRRA